MLSKSISEVVFNLASKLTTAFLPRPVKIFRKASTVFIKLVGIVPCKEKHVHIHSHESKIIRRKPKIRKPLQIHRLNEETEVRSNCCQWFEAKSYQNFLQYHKLKYLSYKTRFHSLKNNKTMVTIQESVELNCSVNC